MKGNSKEKDMMSLSAKEFHAEVEGQTGRAILCKICLSEHHNIEIHKNNIVSPCNCKGELEYVHKDCLGKWIENKWKEGEKILGLNKLIC